MRVLDFKETGWRRLLDDIENGLIIPIIGEELLVVKHGEAEIPLYYWLAKELAIRLNVEIEHIQPLNISEVIYEYQNIRGYDPTLPYYEIFDILRTGNFQIPESLRKLSELPFRLYLTTTIDNYLERAINEFRFNGESRVKSFSFVTSGVVEDIPHQLNTPIVYHIFGESNTIPSYVATEDDLLKFCQKWYNPDKRPSVLNAYLKDGNRYYMLLGCNFQNWLARFFLFGLKHETLFDSNARRDFIADKDSKNDTALAIFLSRCNTEVYPNGNAFDFLKELHNRWQERRKKAAKPFVRETESKRDFIEGSIFLSYASEDKEYAKHIYSELNNLGIDVWFDEKKLESGERYKEVIIKNIQDSSFFIPLITRNTATNNRRFFRFEWNEAIADSKFRTKKMPFIMPIIQGELNKLEIPQEFSEFHVTWINDEDSLKTFATRCQQLLRKYRLTLNSSL